MKRVLKALLTILLFASVLPHELGHFWMRKLCKMSADALVIGDPYKPPLFTWGWFRIGEPSFRYEGMVISYTKNSPTLPKWKPIAVLFAGPSMDILAAYSVILISPFILPAFWYAFLIILILKFNFSALWNMFLIRKKIPNSDEWSEHDGYKIWNTSKPGWFVCLLLIVVSIAYISYEMLFLFYELLLYFHLV
ncbi:site-2 protease family protein [Brevibacillus sp. NPDC058079]|uniref:site-2 protease family protein n=1 Tax=Brevibacillus sp. NPDC058079 TaxID=3346330 RepID=UPI0036EA9D6C